MPKKASTLIDTQIMYRGLILIGLRKFPATCVDFDLHRPDHL